MNRQHGMSTETVDQHFREASTATRDRLFELVTDGELVESSVRNFRYWEELADTTRAVIDAEKSRPFFGRATCAGIMSKVTNRFVREHARVFPAWLKIRTELQETPGPCNVAPRDPEPPEPPCPYGGAIDSLLFQLNGGAPYDVNKLLTQQAARLHMPESWTESLIFVEDLLTREPNPPRLLATLRDNLRARVTELPSAMRRQQEEAYRKRTKERTD